MTEKPTYEELEKKIQKLEQSESNRKRMEEQLIHSQDLMDYIISHARSAIAVHDRDLKYIYVSKRYLEDYKIKEQNIIGKHHYEVFPDLPQKWRDVHKRSLAGEVLSAKEDPYYREDGSVDWTHWECRPWYALDGSIGGIIIDTEVITERKKVEESLRKSEQLLAAHLQNTPVGVISWDLNFKIIEWNPGAESIFGYSRFEAMGKHPTEIILPNDIKELVDGIFQDLISEKGGVRSTNKNTTKDGRLIICDWYNTTLKDADGKVIGVASLVNDITDRKKLEKSLQRSEALLKTTQQLAKIGGWEWNVEKQSMFWTDEVYQIHDFQPGEFTPGSKKHIQRSMECYDPEDRPVIMAAFKRCVEKGQAYDLEFSFTSVMGRRIWIRTVGEPVLEGDKVVRVIGNIMDITKYKQIFEGLKEQKELSEKIIQTSSAIIVGLDKNHRIRLFNRGAERITGFKTKEVIGKDWFEIFFKPGIYDEMDKVWKSAWGTKFNSYVNPIQTKNDDEKIISWQSTGMYDSADDTKHMLISIGEDITERIQAEKALRESEEKYRSMMESMKNASYICSPELYIEYMNPAMIDRVGTETTGDFCYKTIYDRSEKCPWCAFDQVKKGEHIDYEVADPRDNRYYSITNSPIFHSDGSVSKLTIFHDITQIKDIEAQLRQSRKMESIGTLAGGIAHDFNNLLYMISGNAELALGDIPKWNPVHSNLEEIKSASLRAAGIVKQLLNFSRKTDLKLEPIGVINVIKDVLKFLRSTIPTTIDIRKHLPDADITILADPVQINQVMMNLCINASQAMANTGGILEITAENMKLDEDAANSYPDLPAANYLKITISDTGPGIASEIINRIFDPYFTTKEMGKGSGMGLSIVHGIVKNHDGAISVDSKLGKGSIFSLLFPVVDERSKIENEIIDEIPGGKERILFVDDEKAIADMMQKILKHLGYKVEISLNPIQALDLFQSKPDTFDLVITDMTMPQMTGATLSEKLIKIRSDIPIIICTGHSFLIDEEKAKQLGIADYLMKPVSMSKIAMTIRKIFDK
ncbi:MAG: PAS domain S-box protein [Desulfobacteraceae bacterium]|nr:PAS domain S-box protein [Desulfobacteraceae bacterium]